MSTARKLLIVLCLAGIFIAGGAAGALLALRIDHRAGREKAFNGFVVRQLGKMTEELSLTGEQREQVDAILKQGADDLGALRRDAIASTSSKFREMNQKITAILTPEQAARFEEMLKRQRERFRRFQAERAERRGNRDGGQEPSPPPASSNP